MDSSSYLALFCILCNVGLSSADGHLDLIEMSYEFSNETVYYPVPGLKSFTMTNVVKGEQPEGFWLEVNEFETSDQGGTSMHAPSHFSKDGWSINEIPIDRFISPAVVVDVSRHVVNNADYELTVDDLLQWEEQHGMIPDGALVFLYADWARTRWPDVDKYFGINIAGTTTSGFHYPSFSLEAAQWLTENRVIHGIGIDTGSVDHGPLYPVHVHILGSNIYIVESVHNLWLLPPAGATVYSFPMNIKRGSGAPCRLIAHLPKGVAPYPSSKETSRAGSLYSAATLLIVALVTAVTL